MTSLYVCVCVCVFVGGRKGLGRRLFFVHLSLSAYVYVVICAPRKKGTQAMRVGP